MSDDIFTFGEYLGATFLFSPSFVLKKPRPFGRGFLVFIQVVVGDNPGKVGRQGSVAKPRVLNDG